MTLRINPVSVRGLIAIALAGAWLYGLIAWSNHHNGAAAVMKALMGFMALGLVPWIVRPAQMAKSFRLVGAATALVALALLVWLNLMLRGGL
jgi:hypothetical protein